MAAVFFCIVISLLTCCFAYENLALNKTAKEAFPYIHIKTSASNAVDGLKSNLTGLGGQCSLSTINQRTSTWWVNLTSICSIHDIWIYYRTDNLIWNQANPYTARFLGFSIYVSNTTNKSDGKPCYKDDKFTRSTIPAVFNTTCFVHGQYVIYYNERLLGKTYPDGYSDFAFNDLCEVEVYGCQTPGYYGSNCNPCPDVNCQYCHIETGTCQRCKPGYKGDQCELECNNKKYGDGCQRICGNCFNISQCDNVDGTCLQGCEAGYKGQMCDQECTDSFFGPNCQEQCNATCLSCNMFTGICDKGCHPGWKGNYCQYECDGNMYGENCSMSCGNCKSSQQCHYINGTCMSSCEKGYQGSKCDKECANGTYGNNCNKTCGHCVNMTLCYHVNGTCLKGCDPGYRGSRCHLECQNKTYGYLCQKRCGHCLNMAQCDHVHGTCLQGCEAGFGGRTCNLVNLALRKPASEANIYTHANITAGNAVDGRKSNLRGLGGECSTSAVNQRTSTWWVNLESIYSIHDIRIYYRTENVPWGVWNGFTARFLGFSIYVSNTTDKSDGTLCYKDNNFTRSTIPAVFNTTCFKHGQYVIYYNERLSGVIYPSDYSHYSSNDLCEVEVYGCLKSGYYGIDCNLPCPDVNCRYCHIETGTCQGCKPGYKGHQCDLECDKGWYGDECQTQCGRCVNMTQCDHVNGTCSQGCEAGFEGQTCDQECGVGFYGQGCTSQCGNCSDQTDCSPFNGTCLKGCLPGYRGDTCKEQCTDSFFGPNCQEQCNATCLSCNMFTGVCDKGCHPGWKGNYCQYECDGNMYGENCSKSCGNCKNSQQCHYIDGTCMSSCEKGYQGSKCDKGISQETSWCKGGNVSYCSFIMRGLEI